MISTPDPLDELAQEGRLIAEAGAHLEDHVVRARLQNSGRIGIPRASAAS